MSSYRWTKPIVVVLVLTMLLLGPLALGVQASAPGSGPEINWEKVSPELRALLASNSQGNVNIVVQMNAEWPTPNLAGKPAREAKGKIERFGGVASRSLGIVSGASGRIPLGRIAALSRDPAVMYISTDSKLTPMGSPYSGDMVDFTRALNVDQVWSRDISGSGITIAVLDSGVAALPNGIDPGRLIASVDLVSAAAPSPDPGGHGTHVAGIAAGRDADWSGVAPGANIVSVRVIDDSGNASMSTVVQGIQWAVQNRQTYGIRVLNLSLGGVASTSYKKDPLAAAVEVAWHAGIVVVGAAGNSGPDAGTIVTPGYDPFVITVGATDMNSTIGRSDDAVPFFSGRGPTIDGLTKPDVVAPGRKVLSTRVFASFLDRLLPDRVVGNHYFRLSGTSQATAAVSGVAALMLSANPNLSPDQVKRRLMASTTSVAGFDANAVGAGYVNAAEAVKSVATGKQKARPADSFAVSVFPLIKGAAPLTWKDLTYNGGVDSRGVPWSNVAWDNVAWDNVTWDNLAWDNVAWDNVTWDNLAWDSVNITWENATWDSLPWNSVLALD